MTLTLLFDLDDTLLGNDIDAFLPVYLKALGKHLMAYVPPEQMIKELLAATQKMVTNNGGVDSLEQAFDRAFYPAIHHSKEELRQTLEYFYDEVYPGLQSVTQQRPEAVAIVQKALQDGHLLVVATNPLFPRKAILHRLRWAGLDPDQIPFALITTYEAFHFSKPNPAYLAEILAQLGWPDQPAVVIGDSLENDILPATRLGLPAYWVTDAPGELPENLHPLSAYGPLSGVPAWIDQVEQADLRPAFQTPASLLAVLKSTPAALQTLTLGSDSSLWSTRSQEGQWSLTEIFSHLRDVDQEVNLPRLEKVIGDSNPFLQGVNSDTWAEERNYRQYDGVEALLGFVQARTRLVEELSKLEEEDWQRPARHAIFGPTTLNELVTFITTHDRSHIQQALALLKNIANQPPARQIDL